MEINRAAFGALAVVGIVAAGGGAYMANRHNEAELVQPAPMHAAPAGNAVTETENTITSAPAAAVEPAPQVTAPEPAPCTSRTSACRSSRTQRRASAPAPQRARTSPAYGGNSSPSAPVYAPSHTPLDPPVSPAIEPLENTTVDRAPVVQEPPRKMYDELVIPADSVIGLQVENAVTTERAKIEDKVAARVTRDVRVRDQVAIPAGARAEGSVTLVERGGRLKDQARLGIRFHTIVLADGTRLPINTETIYREGESPARESAAKIGGAAVGGAVLGAIFGGKKGAVIGSTVGAAGGGVAVAASEPNAATLPAGSTVTVRMGSPATVTVEEIGYGLRAPELQAKPGAWSRTPTSFNLHRSTHFPSTSSKATAPFSGNSAGAASAMPVINLPSRRGRWGKCPTSMMCLVSPAMASTIQLVGSVGCSPRAAENVASGLQRFQ